MSLTSVRDRAGRAPPTRAGGTISRSHPGSGGTTEQAQMAGQAEEAFRGLLARHAPAIGRVCRHYEAAPDLRRDLEQEVLLALWRAQQSFRGDCSERTWVYRVAHNVGATHVMRAV